MWTWLDKVIKIRIGGATVETDGYDGGGGVHLMLPGNQMGFSSDISSNIAVVMGSNPRAE